jgi:hypothetical protein
MMERQERSYMLPVEGGWEAELRKSGDSLLVDGRLDRDLETKIVPAEAGIRIGDKLLKRTELARPAPAPEQFKGLIGEYGWDHNILYVLEKDGKLNVLIEWFEYDSLQQGSAGVFKFFPRGLYNGERATFAHGRSGRATEVKIGAVVFKRRDKFGEPGTELQARPTQSIGELRRRAPSCATTKGGWRISQSGPHRHHDTRSFDQARHPLRDLAQFSGYAGIYEQAKAFLQRPAAEAMARAAHRLQPLGYGLLIHDAYRPWYVTKILRCDAGRQKDLRGRSQGGLLSQSGLRGRP